MRTLLACIIAAAALQCVCIADGPLHKGKSIHSWLNDLSSDQSEQRVRAENELLLIGTNAIPAMLDYVTSGGSAYSSHDSSVAYRSFEILGPTAKPAIPRLSALANDPNYSTDACQALFLIGRETIPIFVGCLTNQNYQIRDNALEKIIGFALSTNSPADLQVALPAIRALIKNSKTVDAQALGALRVVSTNANEFVADVVPLLKSQDDTTRWCAVESLKMFGPKGKAAIPALLKIANDPVEKVRTSVALAIQAIDPEAAKRHSIKPPIYE
jgi:HEAT repeat protein